MFGKKSRDENILALIQSGNDSKAIAILYDTSFVKIKKHIKHNSGNLQDAEDVFQDGVTILYRNIKNGKFDAKNDIDAYLFTICKNLWINNVHKNSKIDFKEDIQFAEYKNEHKTTQTAIVFSDEREQQIKDVFARLGSKCEALLTQVVYFDATMKELVEKFGFSNEDSAKTQHYKCKQKLIETVGHNETFRKLLSDGI